MILTGDLWTPIGMAIGTFVTLPQAQGMKVGIGFFGVQNDTCDPNVYGMPVVPIGVLPANGPAIQQAINANVPTIFPIGTTPTLPAITGAVTYAQGVAAAVPTDKVIVVLATDGDPNTCNSTIPGVQQVVAGALSGTPSVPTYVIGIGNVANLDQIAQAGGTGKALIVDANAAVASQQFLDAMAAISGAALPCDYAIPAGGDQTPDLVNLAFNDGSGQSYVPNVGDASRCDPAQGGWYYDDPAAPRRILTCDATCNKFKSTGTAQVNVVLGCQTYVF